MAKQEKVCAGCGAPLTFMSTPNFGGGYLKDGERVCRSCFARIVKVQPSFGLRSKKDHTKESIKQILRPSAVTARATVGATIEAHDPTNSPTVDPVPLCMEALQTGSGREAALNAARLAHKRWWAVDVSDREHTMEELMDMLRLRAFVLGAVATVYLWNGEYSLADEVQNEFIDHEGLWTGERREVVELYLIHAIFQQQWSRLDGLFSRASFRSAFLDYQDLYLSVRDPHYPFQCEQGRFLATVNKVNHYCRQIGRERLF